MVDVVSTSGTSRWAEGKSLEFSKASSGNANVIKVDAAKPKQKLLGFGAAMTDAAAWLFAKLKSSARAKVLGELFSPEGLGLTVHRIAVGSSDYARTAYHFAPTADDMDLKDFSTKHDEAYIIPILKEVQALNKDTYIFSSPWSPPGWMKAPPTFYGGWMREKYIGVFGAYYFRFLQDYFSAGVPVHALTPQNEVQTDQISRMPACFWHPEFEAALVRDHLGPMIAGAGFNTKIWLMDHNYVMWERAKWMLDDPAVKKYTDGVAFHPYEGTPDQMTTLHNHHPDIHCYWTEGGPQLGKLYETEYAKWGKQISEILNNWCRSYTGWNYALDETGAPNIGPFKCAGLVTVHSKTRKITYSAQYWILGHFSKFMKRDASVVPSTSEFADIYHVAAVNPDGQRVLVITNEGKPREVKVREGKKEVKVKLPTNSVTTLTWN